MGTTELPSDLRQSVLDFIRLRVAEGFLTQDEILEYGLDYFADTPGCDFDTLQMFLIRHTREALAAHCKAQTTWPPETDCDRLDLAFYVLEEEHGIVARQNFTDCQTCGHYEIQGEIQALQEQRPVIGYTFYHEQDTEGVVDGGTLYLAFGAVEEDEQAEAAVAQRIVTVLREAGLTVDWNGSIKTRILVKDLDWKKRREGCS
jgi:hypothetical protein